MTTGRWDRFWFADASLTRLGAFRILICGLGFYDAVLYGMAAVRDAAIVSAGDVARPWSPIYLFDVLGLTPIGVDAAQWVVVATLVALGLATVGLFSRMTCLLGFLGYLYLSGLVYSFGKPHHDKVALTFALLCLWWAPIGARLSLDSLIGRWRRASRGLDPRLVPERATYAALPLRLTQLSIAIGYGFAGLSKVWIGGLQWFNGYTLQGIMMGHQNVWAETFAQSVMFNRISSLGLVFTQACFPLVFFWPRLLWFFIPVATSFHLITWATMDTGPYMRLWFAMCAFLPLESVPKYLRSWLRTWKWPFVVLLILVPSALVWCVLARVIPVWALLIVFGLPAIAFVQYLLPVARVDIVYDGACRMCRRTLAVLLAIDWGQRVRVLDLSRWPEVSDAHPGLEHEACVRDMHVIDAKGCVTTGFDGYRVLAWRLPLTLLLAPLLYLPPVPAIGRRIYRHVADRRLREGCGDEQCPV